MKRIMQLLSVVFILLLSTQATAQGQWLEEFHLAQYENKVVYLDFWASWCGPCRKSFPWLNEMQAKYQDKGLVIIGINLDRDIKNAYSFLNAFPTNFRLYADPKGLLATHYKVVGMPSSYIFSGNGELVEKEVGFKKNEQKVYEARIVTLLQQLTPPKSRDW